jgi:hypothetical protein
MRVDGSVTKPEPTVEADQVTQLQCVFWSRRFVPYRRFTCTTLTSLRGWQFVGEACDGLEAIQKAIELRPDLIVLDIELSSLNGIEVAPLHGYARIFGQISSITWCSSAN